MDIEIDKGVWLEFEPTSKDLKKMHQKIYTEIFTKIITEVSQEEAHSESFRVATNAIKNYYESIRDNQVTT